MEIQIVLYVILLKWHKANVPYVGSSILKYIVYIISTTSNNINNPQAHRMLNNNCQTTGSRLSVTMLNITARVPIKPQYLILRKFCLRKQYVCNHKLPKWSIVDISSHQSNQQVSLINNWLLINLLLSLMDEYGLFAERGRHYNWWSASGRSADLEIPLQIIGHRASGQHWAHDDTFNNFYNHDPMGNWNRK